MRLIYLAPLAWDSFSQRPHELVRYFHERTGGEVLWIDSYPTRLPQWSDLKRSRHIDRVAGDAPPWITVVSPKALPIEPLPCSGRINRLLWGETLSQIDRFPNETTILGIGKPSHLALQILRTRKFSNTFYDAMDDFPAFYRGWSHLAMARRERDTVRAVSTILASSSSLHTRLKQSATDVRLVLNACASGRLPDLGRRNSPNESSLIIGYVGTIAQWFDWELVTALAKACPQAQLRLIGPVYCSVPPSLPSNISIEPPVPHAQALNEMTQFDLGLIPFMRTPLTSSVDPIKYYEYRALGLPVLSTSFGEMALRGEADGVFLIDRDSAMVKIVDLALRCHDESDQILQFRKENSWESRFDGANIFHSEKSF